MEVAAAKVILEIYGCQTEKAKAKTIKPWIESLKKEFNISVEEFVEEENFDPERVVIAVSLVAPTRRAAQTRIKKVITWIDENTPARMTYDDACFWSFE